MTKSSADAGAVAAGPIPERGPCAGSLGGAASSHLTNRLARDTALRHPWAAEQGGGPLPSARRRWPHPLPQLERL